VQSLILRQEIIENPHLKPSALSSSLLKLSIALEKEGKNKRKNQITTTQAIRIWSPIQALTPTERA